MDSRTFVHQAIEICEDCKTIDLQVYDVGEKSVLADFYMVASGSSSAHIRAISQKLGNGFKDSGILPKNIEGTPESHWILMDYIDVLIHIFLQDTRDRYKLEQLFDKDQLIYPV